MNKIIVSFLLISQIAFGQFWTTKTQAKNVLITDILQSGATEPQYKTLQDLINIVVSSGKISGGQLVDAGLGKVHVRPADVIFKTTESRTGITSFAKIDSVSNLSLVDSMTNYVLANYNNGNPIVFSTIDPTPIFGYTSVLLSAVYRQGNLLHIVDISDNGYPSFFARANLKEVEKNTGRGFGFAERVPGSALTDSVGTRYIKITGGVFYAGYDRFVSPAFNSFTVPTDTFTLNYRDGLGGFVNQTGLRQINNTVFDNGTGVPQTLQVNRYSNRWLYLSFDANEIIVVLGRNEYVLIADALAASPPSDATLPKFVSTFSTPLAQIVARQGSDLLTIKQLQ